MAHLEGQENLESREVSIEMNFLRNPKKNAGIDNVRRNPVGLVLALIHDNQL